MLLRLAFAQQFRILLRLRVLELIECLIGSSERRRLNLLFDGLDILHRYFEALQRFLRNGLLVCQREYNFVEPTQLLPVTRHLGDHPIFDSRVAGIIDRERWREPGGRYSLVDGTRKRQTKHPERIKARRATRHTSLLTRVLRKQMSS